MRLNHRWPELRGTANPNQTRYHCSFARFQVFIFSRNDSEDLDLFNLKRDTIPELWAATEKALSPFLQLTQGTTS